MNKESYYGSVSYIDKTGIRIDVGLIKIFENVNKYSKKSPDFYGFLHLKEPDVKLKVSLWRNE